MDFEQIRAFLNVAVLRSFSEAAEKMFISQPSVSMRIKALEEELGVVLFDRSKAREPSLTDAGRIFFDYAQSMLNMQDECREKLSGVRSEAAGLLYIGASTVPGIFLIPDLLVKFKRIAPKVSYNINVLDTSAVLEGILNYSYDLGFVGLIKQDDRLCYIKIAEDELLLCSRKGTLSKKNIEKGIPPDKLAGYQLILREKGSATRQLLEKRFAEEGLSLDNNHAVIYYNSMEGIKEAVRAGLGVAVLSNLSVQDLCMAGEIETCKIAGIDLKRSLYLVHHKSRVLGWAARNFIGFTVSEFG